MAHPPLGTAPAVDQLAGVDCPIECAAAITRLVRTYGTLPVHLSNLRKEKLRQARKEGHKVIAIARRVGLSRGRISQLSQPAGTES